MSFVLKNRNGRFVIDSRQKLGSMISNELSLHYLSAFFSKLPRVETLVDAGAGKCPFEPLYRETCAYPISFDVATSPFPRSKWTFQASIEAIPLQDNFGDVIFCSEVIEHIRDPGKGVGELSRICKPGGYVVLTSPFFLGVHEPPNDFYRYTEFGLRHLCGQAGLEVLVIQPKGELFGVFLSLVIRIQMKFWNTLADRCRFKACSLWNPLVLVGMYLPQKIYAHLFLKVSRSPSAWVRKVMAYLTHHPLGYVTIARKPLSGSQTPMEERPEPGEKTR